MEAKQTNPCQPTTKPKTKKKTAAAFPDVFIPLGEFDKTKLIVQTPRKIESGGFTAIKSRLLYKTVGKDGEEVLAVPYVSAAPQSCYISPSYPIGEEAGKQDTPQSTAPKPKDLIGYQLTYPLASWQTRSKPTGPEIATKQMLDEAVEVVRSTVPKYANITYPGTEELVFASSDMRAGIKKPDDTRLKPLYAYPALKDKATGKKILKKVVDEDGNVINQVPQLDTSKSQNMYVKFMTFGKNEELKVFTKLYDTDQQEINVSDVGKKGFVQPVFKLADVYYGKNKDNDYLIYIQIRLSHAVYEEEEQNSVPDYSSHMFEGKNRLNTLFDEPVPDAKAASDSFVPEANGSTDNDEDELAALQASQQQQSKQKSKKTSGRKN